MAQRTFPETTTSQLLTALGAGSGLYTKTPGTYFDQTISNATTYYSSIVIPVAQTLDRIAVRTGSTFSGTALTRLGIYNHNPVTGKPTTVLLDAGNVNCAASNSLYTITISQVLQPGIYWLAVNTETTSNFGLVANPDGLLQWSNGSTTSLIGWKQDVITSSGYTTAGTLVATASVVPALVRGV
jgi:hypothetical protein